GACRWTRWSSTTSRSTGSGNSDEMPRSRWAAVRSPRSVGRGRVQHVPHRSKLALERVEQEPETLERQRAEQPGVPGLPEDDRGATASSRDLETCDPDGPGEGRPIREREAFDLFGLDPQRPELLGRDDREDGSRIDEHLGFDPTRTVGRVADANHDAGEP